MTEAALSITDEIKWVTLYFHRKDYLGDMAKFVNELTAKISNLRGSRRIRVGINAINIEPVLFEEIRCEFTPEKFRYIVT